MANIRKSFNFRNGVQVDNDNLVVNTSGLVGIGTSVPTELFDVRGTAKFVGLVTANELNVTGVSTFQQASVIGVITATAFYGDGATLSNLPTSQWVDVNAGLGFTSIYAAGNVGVGTTDPRFVLQIGGNNDISNFTGGVGFNSFGGMRATGIVTAYEFVGYGTNIEGLDASNITLGTIDNAYLPIIDNGRFPANINVTGIITAQTGFAGTFTGNILGVAVTAQQAQSIVGQPNINVGIITATNINAGSFLLNNSGIGTFIAGLQVGTSGTVFSASNGGFVGVGTALPSADFEVIRSDKNVITNILGKDQARLGIGTIGVGQSAYLIYDGLDSSFDIRNDDIGNIKFTLHSGPVVSGLSTGKFQWIYGQNLDNLMSLTYDGKLGIQVENPETTLHVGGGATITGNLNVNGGLILGTPGNTIELNPGQATVLNNVNLNSNSGITTLNTIHVLTNVGIATTLPNVGFDAKNIEAAFGSIGISTTAVKSDHGMSLFVANGNSTALIGPVGIGSTISQAFAGNTGSMQIHGQGLIVFGRTGLTGLSNAGVFLDQKSILGVGTTATRAMIDFSSVGSATSTIGFMLPPNQSRTSIAGIGSTNSATLYNTDLNALQVFDGANWGVVQSPAMVRVAGDRTKATNNTGLEGIFATANDTLTLRANRLYRFRGTYYIAKSATTIVGLLSTGFMYGNNAPQSILYDVTSFPRTIGSAQTSVGGITTSAPTIVTGQGTAAENYVIQIDGWVESHVSVAGTFTPAISQSQPGTAVAPTIQRGSWFEIQDFGPASGVTTSNISGSWY